MLVDSEEINQEIEIDLLAKQGIRYEAAEFARRFSGTSEREFFAMLRADAIERHGIELADSFFQGMNDKCHAEFEIRLSKYAGVDVLIERWPKTLAVASSSALESLLFKLNKVALAEPFGENIFSADSVSKAKPDPALYVFAANALSVAPERCIAIEDSINGVLSATRAGMTTIGYVGGAHCVPKQNELLIAEGAAAVFDTHQGIQDYLGIG